MTFPNFCTSFLTKDKEIGEAKIMVTGREALELTDWSLTVGACCMSRTWKQEKIQQKVADLKQK